MVVINDICCEKFIDKLYVISGKAGLKPRTYRREIDKAYLDYQHGLCPTETYVRFKNTNLDFQVSS